MSAHGSPSLASCLPNLLLPAPSQRGSMERVTLHRPAGCRMKKEEEHAMSTPKFYRSQISPDGTSKCPWCGNVNKHNTGNVCEHVAKLTNKGVVFFYWGTRPLTEDGQRIIRD